MHYIGIEDRIFPVLTNVASSWLIALPLMYLLAVTADLGPIGLPIALLIAYSIASTAILGRWINKINRDDLFQTLQTNNVEKEFDDSQITINEESTTADLSIKEQPKDQQAIAMSTTNSRFSFFTPKTRSTLEPVESALHTEKAKFNL